MSRQTQWIVYIVIAVVLIFSFYKLVNVATSVSYPYGEEYRVDANANKVIGAIITFKKQHPEYCVPDSLTMPGGKAGKLTDGPRGKGDYWYHAYFYYRKENQVIKTWIKPNDSSNATFAFDAVNDGLKIGYWRGVNKDYNETDREQLKEIFEQRILKEIKALAEQN